MGWAWLNLTGLKGRKEGEKGCLGWAVLGKYRTTQQSKAKQSIAKLSKAKVPRPDQETRYFHSSVEISELSFEVRFFYMSCFKT